MNLTNYIYESTEADWRGCLMLSLPLDVSAIIDEWSKNNILGNMLADSGRETYCHCTVLYGFSQDIKFADVKKFIDEEFEFDVRDFTQIKLGKIKRFEANEHRPDSDVIVIDVKDFLFLQKMNAALKDKFNVVNNYKGYNPHVTIAYVIPNTLKELDGNDIFYGYTVKCREFRYSMGSSKSRTQTVITFDEFAKKSER